MLNFYQSVYLSSWVADNANLKPYILKLKLKPEPQYLIKFGRTCGIIDMIIVQVVILNDTFSGCRIVNLIHFTIFQKVGRDPKFNQQFVIQVLMVLGSSDLCPWSTMS